MYPVLRPMTKAAFVKANAAVVVAERRVGQWQYRSNACLLDPCSAASTSFAQTVNADAQHTQPKITVCLGLAHDAFFVDPSNTSEGCKLVWPKKDVFRLNLGGTPGHAGDQL